MKYIEFIKDNPRTGNKVGDKQKLRSKIPPHLERYVKEISKKSYESNLEELLDAEDEALKAQIEEEQSDSTESETKRGRKKSEA